MPAGPVEIAFLTDALKLIIQFFSQLPGSARIDESFEAPCRSRPSSAASSMSVAAIQNDAAYRDSGQRYFFTLERGIAKVRRAVAADWTTIEEKPGTGQAAISYDRKREGERLGPVQFDMIAAGAGRILVKETGFARFYFTMMDPNFRFRGNGIVNSTYFKLDPETGRQSADNRDRLAHLDIEQAKIAHPAAVRFPLFRILASLDQVDNMAVNVDRNPRVWHLIDLRSPADGVDPPEGLPHVPASVGLVRYVFPDGSTKEKKGIPIYRVLDIGVGHEHWHEQECAVYGGEMDSLDGPGLPPVLMERDVYRFFNGPIDDKGGFVDGTANYYVLAELVKEPAGGPQEDTYGILWMDEQAVFSERWRLLHPDDCRFGGFREIVPSALVQYLSRTPWYYRFAFDQRKYFCPFRAKHVGGGSRMAVARQVIVVNGYDPGSRLHRFYTINFSFGTCDRTWRWRELPPLHEIAGEPAGRAGDRAVVPFESFGLREDMTLYVVQRHQGQRFVWYQRYLPADHRHSPDGDRLRLPDSELVQRGPAALARLIQELASPPSPPEDVSNGPMPAEGFDHPWQVLPAHVWEAIHSRYSHFGCLQDEVNWRCQYYLVDVDPAEIPPGTLDGERLWDSSNALFIRQPCLDWHELNSAIETAGNLTAPLVAWAREFERTLQELDAAARTIQRQVVQLRLRLEAAWKRAGRRLEDLLGSVGASGRSSARSRVKTEVIDRALSVLRDVPLYENAPSEVRDLARDTLRSIVEDVLNHELFNALWSAVGGVAQESADLLADLRRLNPSANLTSQLSDLVLDRIEAAVRSHFGGNNPRIELSIPVKLDVGPIHFNEKFELGRVSIPLGSLTDAVRSALRSLAFFEDAMRELADEIGNAADAAADKARAELERSDLLERIDALVNPGKLRERLASLVARATGDGLFVRTVHRRSLFHDRFFLKLLHRPPRGYILVHWDKRDDDLLPFNELAAGSRAAIPVTLQRQDGRSVHAVVRGWRRVNSPPAVFDALVRVARDSAGRPTLVVIRFRTPVPGPPLDENVWRVRMAGLPSDGATFGPADVFFDVLIHETFRLDRQSGLHTYSWNLATETAGTRERVARYCSDEGRRRHGTSLWFENIVGHVSAPDVLTFA